MIGVQAAWENDWYRLFPMMLSYTLYGILQGINLLRYPDTLDWSRLSATTYAIFVFSVLLVGAYGTWKAWRVKQARGLG